MQIKRFEAKDMTSALRLIKKELGSDAVILSARNVKKENKLLGLVKSVGVEVTAAIDTFDLPVKAASTAFSGTLDAYRQYGQAGNPGRRSSRRVAGRRMPPRPDRKPLLRSEDAAGLTANHMLGDLFEHLLTQEVKRDLAVDIVAHLNQRQTQGRFETSEQIIAEIASLLKEKSRPAAVRSERRSGVRIVAVVGPSGVGKTTTIAKLAARHALEQRQTVALISLDADRIGATAELKIYAQAMGIPLQTAAKPAAFAAAVDELRQCDLILVDTPGLNPTNSDKIDALRKCMEAIGPVEIHLALSAVTKESDLDNTLRHLNPLTIEGLIFTKLDESCTFGNLVNLHCDYPLPLSYLTDGREVPEAIKAGSMEHILQLLLADFKLPTPASTPIATYPPSAETGAGSSENAFVANKNSDVFHCADCKWTQKIKPKHLIRFTSAAGARKQQFVPCRDCQPDKKQTFQFAPSTTRDSVRISNCS